MQDYKIYILDKTGHIVLAYGFQGSDDKAAMEESKKHSNKTAVEIWQRSRLIARVDQGGKAAIG